MNWDAATLKMECEAADRFRDKIVEPVDARLQRYYGQGFGYDVGEYWPENYYFTWVSYVLPQIVFQNPRVKIGSLRLDAVAADAKALEIAVNRWIKDTNYRQHLRRMAFDMGFCYGVSYTRPVPGPWAQGDNQKVAYRPECTAINQRLYSLDPQSDGPWNARFQQHIVIDDKNRLLEWAKDHNDEGWNAAAIKAAGTVTPHDLTKSTAKDVPDREQIAYRIIWCPEEDSREEEDSEEDYHGTIYTLALYPSSDKEIEWLREPYAFMGPRSGPYTVFGAYTVPGCPYPLAPLAAVDAQLKELNALALANYRAGRNRKRIGIYDKTLESEAADIAKCEDGGTVGITGFDKAKFIETELGGITATGLAQEEHARSMADRATGLNDNQRGQIDTGALATEILQATAATNVRTADLSEQFTAADRQELSIVAWYMWRFERVMQPLTVEDQAQLAQALPPEKVAEYQAQLQADPKAQMYFSGEGNRQPFDSLELEIEPYSMKRTDEPLMQQRAMQAIQLASSLAPVILQAPFIRWKTLLEKLGDSMNWPGFADILDEKMAAELSMMLLQGAGGEPSKATGPSAQPRLEGDLKPPTQGHPSPKGAQTSGSKAASKAPAMNGAARHAS